MVFVETSVFTRQVQALLRPEEYRQLQMQLAIRPSAGAVVRGSGGLRKVRWAAQGRGKRGGVRIIYFWAKAQEKIVMLLIYSKTDLEDLTREQLKILRNIVEAEYS